MSSRFWAVFGLLLILSAPVTASADTDPTEATAPDDAPPEEAPADPAPAEPTVEGLTAEVERLSGELSEAKASAATFRQAWTDAQQRLAVQLDEEFRYDHQALRRRLDTALEERDEARRQRDEANGRWHDNQEERGEMLAEVQRIRAEYEEFLDGVALLETQLREKTLALAKAQQQIAERDTRIAALEGRPAEATSSDDAPSAEPEPVAEVAVVSLDALDAEIACIEKRLEDPGASCEEGE